MKLTDEQQKAVDEFSKERDVKVMAYAGAGKTSTLVAMANADETRSGLYIAFNKRIAEEADRKFPFNVRCSTSHSLAWRAMSKQYPTEKMKNNPRMLDAGIGAIGGFSPGVCRELVTRTLRNFMQSDRPEVDAFHTPGLLHLGLVKEDTSPKVIQFLTEAIVKETARVWERMISKRHRFPLGHDGYLKLWAMQKPRIETDVLFVDEAQDLNPVLLAVLERQHCQVVYVGDRHQSIYGWRGAVDAMKRADGKLCRLTQSFRFGQQIACEANKVLKMLRETVPLQGTITLQDEVCYHGSSLNQDVDAILCRTNGGVIERAAQAFDANLEVYIPGGVEELKAWVRDAQRLLDGFSAGPGELMAFKNWAEVVEFADSAEGGHLKVFVRLVNDYGPQDLLRILDRVLKEPGEDGRYLTISTTHKAKGLEWNSVQVADDFLVFPDTMSGRTKVGAEQVRLLYVAMTRAKTFLTLPSGLLRGYMEADIMGLE